MKKIFYLFAIINVILITSCYETDTLIDVASAPTASFTLPFDNCQSPCSITISNNSLGYENQYIWNFGDGTSSTEFEPSHQYTAAGNYQITLSVTNNYGNANTNRTLKVD